MIQTGMWVAALYKFLKWLFTLQACWYMGTTIVRIVLFNLTCQTWLAKVHHWTHCAKYFTRFYKLSFIFVILNANNSIYANIDWSVGLSQLWITIGILLSNLASHVKSHLRNLYSTANDISIWIMVIYVYKPNFKRIG